MVVIKYQGCEVRTHPDLSSVEKETIINFDRHTILKTDRMTIYSCIRTVMEHLLQIDDFEVQGLNKAIDDEGKEFIYGVRGTLPISHLRLKDQGSKYNRISYVLYNVEKVEDDRFANL